MAEKKFEKAMERLEQIVQDLEEGELTLEESLKVFEEGMKLARFCNKKLEEAEKKVTMLVNDEKGNGVQIPFEPDGDENGK